MKKQQEQQKTEAHEEITIPIDAIICAPEFQVRDKIHDNVIKDYITKLEAGEDLGRLQVAELEGCLFLISGWHRLLAMKALKRKTVDVEVKRNITTHEAGWLAAESNLKHGLRLSSENERYNVFLRYMWAKKDVDIWSKVKSFAQQSKELHGCISDQTVSNWTKKYFPDRYRLHGKQEFAEPQQQEVKKIPYKNFYEKQVIKQFERCVEMWAGIDNPKGKKRVLKALKKMFKEQQEDSEQKEVV